MLFGSKKIFGLDIGTSTIKAIELDVSGASAQLINFGFSQTPAGAFSAGEIFDPGAIGLTVRDIIKEYKIKRKAMAMGMCGTTVIVKKISVPKMDAKSLPEHLKFEAEQYIPFDINQISLTHHILRNQTSPDNTDLLLIGAQNDFISQYLQVSTQSGIKKTIIDVNGFALANIFEFNYGRLNEVIGLFNFGASTTNFVVMYNGDVIFCRDIPVGGLNFTNELHKSLGISVAEAEALKLDASNGKEMSEEIQNSLQVSLDNVIDEINNSIEFFNATSNGVSISRCFFTGGSCATPGLIDNLSRITNLQFDLLNPFARVKTPKKYSESYIREISPFVSIALGLGLRKQGD